MTGEFEIESGVELIGVAEGSPAGRAGLKSGDRLMRIEGRPVEDLLDLQYHLSSESVELEVQRDGSILHLPLARLGDEDLGWRIEPLKMRTCRCQCIFCFVDQLPGGLRPALYLKDEDYRHSFLFGNYLTLVGLTSHDLDRILRLRLSPLYVSIHAADPSVRGRLLGLKSAPILPRLARLIKGGIQIHGQIVLVPGINDGDVLVDSLRQLMPLYPGLASLSVVPVGLTRHREGLPSLRLLNMDEVCRTLETVGEFQQKMLSDHGHRWVFPSDELLLLAGEELPREDEYEDYPQIENGVGLTRWTLERAEEALKLLPANLLLPRRLLWVTGELAYPILSSLTEEFCRHIGGLDIEVAAAQNHLLGRMVTVAGLLGGQDISAALEEHFRRSSGADVDEIFLPPDCLNPDGLLLDDWTAEDISARSGKRVRVFSGDWGAMILGEDEAKP